jgi:hypothetical protein
MSLDPFGKLINGDEQVGEATSCLLQWSDQVESLNGEWPCDENRLQGVSQEMGLLKQVQILSFLVEPVLQFVDLLELHSLVRKEFSFISCTRGLNMRWRGVPSSNACLILQIRRDSPIDMEAFVSRVIAIIGRVGVRSAEIVV